MTPELNTGTTSRSGALRAELVKHVAETRPTRPLAHSGRVAVAAVLAFALAGATTGGAVAATGVLTPPTSVDLSMDVIQFIGDPRTEFIGVPLVITGTGETNVQLGPRPDGATAIALRVACLDLGRFDVFVDDRLDGWIECDSERVIEGSAMGDYSMVYELTDAGPQSITVRGASLDRYVIWVSWAVAAAPVEPSPTQVDALADGVVTREEYVAGLDRFITCMAESGWTVAVIDREADVIDYSIDTVSGFDDQLCYESEFYQLDMAWQASME